MNHKKEINRYYLKEMYNKTIIFKNKTVECY